MYLQLAEGNETVEIPVDNPYIYVPAFLFERYGIRNPIPGQEGMFIREDWFDDLEGPYWNKMMRELARYQPSGVSEGEHLADRASRKAKRAERKENRKEKKAEKKEDKAIKKAAKQENKALKKEAKAHKKEARQANRQKAIEGVSGALGGILKGVAGAFGVGPAEEVDNSGSTLPEGSLPEKEWYQKPVTWIVGGIVVLGAGYAIYQYNKPKPATRSGNESPSRAA